MFACQQVLGNSLEMVSTPRGPTLAHRGLRWFGHQRWIKRGRGRLVMRFAGPGRVPPIPFTVPFFGMHYVGWLNDFVDWNVYFMGAYSPHELAFLADACRAIRLARGSVNCFDVGANVGQHSLFLSKHADQVVAFEPNPVPLRSLKAKAERNRLDNLRVIEAALGAREEELDLYLPNAFNTGTGSLKPETANDPVVARVRVATLPRWRFQ
jgi:hypothetical protein